MKEGSSEIGPLYYNSKMSELKMKRMKRVVLNQKEERMVKIGED